MLTTVVTSLILCAVEFLTIILASPIAKPGLVLRFLPEDIREAAKDHPEPPKWKQLIAHILLGIFLLAFLGGIVFLGVDGLHRGYGFWKLTLRFMIALYIVKLFDIVVQDQWLVMTSGFFQRIFPETKDCAGWHDRGFNNKNQIVRIVAYPFLCMLTAALFLWIGGDGMIVLQLVLYCLLFTAMVKIAVRGGAVDGLYFYPKAVQERVFALGLTDRETMHKKRRRFMTAFYLVMLTALILIIAVWNKADTFKTAYLQALLFLEVMNLYDGIVIDKLWVGHSKFWIIKGTEDLPFVQTWGQVLKKRSVLSLIWLIGAVIVAGIVVLLTSGYGIMEKG